MVACGNGNTRAREDAATAEVKGGGGGVVVCAVGVFLFAFRFVVLFSLRFVFSSACLLVRAWEWVSRRGTSHNSLWFSRRTRAVGGEKQPFTLSLFLFLPLTLSLCCWRLLLVSVVVVIYAVFAYCFTRTSLKSTLDALLALVNLKHASPSGAGKTETFACVCGMCAECVCVCSPALSLSHTHTNWSIYSLWFTTAFVCSILRLLIVSLFRSRSLYLTARDWETHMRQTCYCCRFYFSYSILLSVHFSFNCYCCNAWKTNRALQNKRISDFFALCFAIASCFHFCCDTTPIKY